MADVVGLLASGQQCALAALSSRLGQPFTGLTAAARAARRQGVLSSSMVRKCERLDVAAHYARHCTSEKMGEFLGFLEKDFTEQEKDFTEQEVKEAPGLNLVEEIVELHQVQSQGKKSTGADGDVDLGVCVPTPPHAGEGTKSTFPAQGEHDAHVGSDSNTAKRQKHDQTRDKLLAEYLLANMPDNSLGGGLRHKWNNVYTVGQKHELVNLIIIKNNLKPDFFTVDLMEEACRVTPPRAGLSIGLT